MDKQNYTLKGLGKQDIQSRFSALTGEMKRDLEEKILRRKRVLKSLEVLLTAIALYFIDQLSFQRLSDTMALQYGVEMSDTAWRKQFLKAAPFLLEWTQQQRETEEGLSFQEPTLGCSSVHAVDATDFSEQGGKTTSRRAHTVFSVTKLRCVQFQVTDGHGGESLTRFDLQPDVLYLADRGYGRPPQLAYAIRQGAAVIVRISPSHTAFYTDRACQYRLSFPELMKGGSFSKVVYFKQREKANGTRKTEVKVYSLRLLGAPLPEEELAKAENRVRRKASRKQRKPSEETISYAKWIFLATTLCESYPAEEILRAYRLRWQIELHFKRAKSLLNFHKLRRSSDAYKDGIVSLWLTLSFLSIYLQLNVLSKVGFPISEYNAFSLVRACLC